MNNENQITPPNDATDKQDFLLSVAEELFAEHGFDGTSIRMIAEQSGMNVAMISYYFGSKEKMFEELIGRKVAHMRTLAQQMDDMKDCDAWHKLVYLVEGYTDRIINNQASFHKLMMREISLRKRPAIVQMIEERIATNMGIIRNVLTEGISAGIFRSDIELPMLIIVIFGSINHTVSAKNLIMKMSILEGKPVALTPEDLREKVKEGLKVVLARYMLVNPAHYNLQ